MAALLVLVLCKAATAGPVSVNFGHVRSGIEDQKDLITTLCARQFAVPKAVTLVVKGRTTNIEGELDNPLAVSTANEPPITITANSTDPFAECFAREAMQNRPSTRWIKQGFSGELPVAIDHPDRVLARVLDEWHAEDDNCRPHAGALPTAIKVDITSDDVEMTVKVAMTPANAALEACELASLNALLLERRIDTGVWKPTAHIKRAVRPVMSNARLRDTLDFTARDIAASCVPRLEALLVDEAINDGTKPPRLGTMTVSVRAKRDAKAFIVLVRSGDRERDSCTTEAMTKALHGQFERQLDDTTRFFRIDGNASATLRFAIETEAQRQARHDEERALHRRRRR